jgi:hypothetical protein
MALKDAKSIQVTPAKEEGTVRLFQSFGWELKRWELKSTQEVKTQDVQVFAGQDSGGTEHYETTRGERDGKLTFERDPLRQNYAELKSLEGQYYSVKDPLYPDEPVCFGLLWGILTVVGLIFFPVSIAIIIWRCVRYSKKKKIWNEAYAVYSKEIDAAEKKRKEFLEKAQSLI